MPEIIYNVTVNIADEIEKDWLDYMHSKHIPDVLATGMFYKYRMSRVLTDDDTGITYAVQYHAKDLESYKLYQQLYAPKLQKEPLELFQQKMIAFRTLLELISESE
jgi:hypothetical protein